MEILVRLYVVQTKRIHLVFGILFLVVERINSMCSILKAGMKTAVKPKTEEKKTDGLMNCRNCALTEMTLGQLKIILFY